MLWAVATNPKPCSIMSVTAASLLDKISRIRRAFLLMFWLKSVFLFVIVGSWGRSIMLWCDVSLGTQSLLDIFTLVVSLLSTSGGVDGGVESGGTTSNLPDVSSLSVCRVSAVLLRSGTAGWDGPRPPVTPVLAPPEPRNKARWTAAAAASGKGG